MRINRKVLPFIYLIMIFLGELFFKKFPQPLKALKIYKILTNKFSVNIRWLFFKSLRFSGAKLENLIESLDIP